MSLYSLLVHLNQIANQNHTGPVACHWCNNSVNIIKYGKYKRYNFTGNDFVDIQRYLCKHDKCRRTFSILPHPFLRITRFTLCMLTELLRFLKESISIAQMTRRLNMNWPTISQLIAKAEFIFDWIKLESKTDPVWGPNPCMKPLECWSNFIRMFAAKFYPKRYGAISPTEMIN